MDIQSLSICVPAGCPNKCKGCVSKMHDHPYPNLLKYWVNGRRDVDHKHYIKRIEFARDNGCNTCVITGNGEPLSNEEFLEVLLHHLNSNISNSFKWIEIQTSGVLLSENMLRFLRDSLVSTISLSVWDVFDDDSNMDIMGTPEDMRYHLKDLCEEIKKNKFNLRLSLNMSKLYNPFSPEVIMDKVKELGADQVTFRKLFKSENGDTPQDKWIEENQYKNWNMLSEYIIYEGKALEVLPFGATRYSLNGISTVQDHDCMSVAMKPTLKYLVLRPNCRLYTKWDDPGSLLF